MKRKESSTVVYLIFFFAVILAFCAFAVDATYVYTVRSKLQNATEAAALAGASVFNQQSAGMFLVILDKTNSTFNLFKQDNLKAAKADIVDVSASHRQVLVKSSIVCEPFFLSFLGVSGIKLNAAASAVSEKLQVSANPGVVDWITANATYRSDVISDANANGTGVKSASDRYRDTAILPPIGNSPSTSVNSETGLMRFDFLDALVAGKALSLGPGGYITMRLPVPIVDKPGPDLFIEEVGSSVEGYFVFAGLDKDPTNPYVEHDRPGSGIMWVNISCTGTPPTRVDSNNVIGAYSVTDVTSPAYGQTKFYGSGNFDIGASCSAPDNYTGVSMVKYIRIIDDNDESAFVKNTIGTIDSTYYRTYMYGESSTPTAGADIHSVQVLNHVRLVHPNPWPP